MTAPASTATAYAAGQKLTHEEIEQARLFIQQTQNAVVGATKGLSETQWKYKPAPDRWSIAENLAHVVVVQERVLGPILEQLATAPAPPDGIDNKVVDSIVIHQFPNRLAKFSAPESVNPGESTAPAELLNRLSANCRRLADSLDRPGLRQHAVPAPPLKGVSKGAYEFMDGYQWILAAAAHTERHAKQMLEVIADPGYLA
jgi:DinB superfamily